MSIETATVGDPDASDARALLVVVHDGCRPFQVVALGAPGAQTRTIPLLEDRGVVEGQATAYMWRGFAFQAPVTEPRALQLQLTAHRRNNTGTG